MKASTPSGRHVALLRGINVGGKHLLPMAALREIFMAAGCTTVATYIQSGNVVFTPSAAGAEDDGRRVRAAIAKRFAFDVPLVLRRATAIRHAIESSPFRLRGVSAEKLYVAFLSSAPTSDVWARVDIERLAPDELELHGADLHLHLPNGVAGTKVTNAYLDRTLETVSTLRNWLTIIALCELGERGDDTGTAPSA